MPPSCAAGAHSHGQESGHKWGAGGARLGILRGARLGILPSPWPAAGTRCVAVRCSVLQCVAVCCNMHKWGASGARLASLPHLLAPSPCPISLPHL